MSTSVRTIDGTDNNLTRIDWGSTGVQLLREAAAAYANGISTPGGTSRPSAREISNVIASMESDEDILNNRDMSAFVYAWGQFLDHDLDLTGSASPRESFNVVVPTGDPSFDPNSTGTQVIPLSRSQYDPTTGTSTSNPRQQTNTITAWIDGSVVYGSDAIRAAALRTFVGGKLKTSADNLLPFNTDGLSNANDAHIVADSDLFLAGDVRANENIELSSLQTLFVREHNRLATQIAKDHPSFTDEIIYQRARAMVIGEIESITYNEFLPALLGPNALSAYRGYNSKVNPNIATEFSTAAYRFGHSMLGNDVEFMDNNGNDVADAVSLSQVFFNPEKIESLGIDPILKYLASDRAQEIDTKVVDSVRNFLFGPPGAGGLDLASLNIQRGRDHGLADYNTVRAAYGLPRVTSFAQITSNVDVQQKLKQLYGNVNNIDLWVGGLAEDHVAGGSMGATFRKIITDQFQRLRDGERFWFENQFSGTQLAGLEKTTLASVIKRNTSLTNLQQDVFFFKTAINGVAFSDRNSNGRRDLQEPGLGGVTFNLLDDDGTVIDTATTNSKGQFRFVDEDLGSYTIQEIVPDGWSSPVTEQSVALTRGMSVSGINFADQREVALNQPSQPPLQQPPQRDPMNPDGPRPPRRIADLIDLDQTDQS